MLITFIFMSLLQAVDETWEEIGNKIVQRYFIKMPLQNPLFKDKKLFGKEKKDILHHIFDIIKEVI